MTSRRKSFGRFASTFGISVLAAMSLMAFAAVGAQASEWTVGGKTLKEKGIAKETFEASGTSFSFHWGSVAIKCGGYASKGSISQGGTGTSLITLTGCNFPEPEAIGCTLTNETIKAELSTTLSKDGTYAIFGNGGTIAIVRIEKLPESECFLIKPGFQYQDMTISGKFAGETGADAIQLPVAFSNAIQTAAQKAGLIGALNSSLWGSAGYIVGSTSMKMTGPNTGSVLGAI